MISYNVSHLDPAFTLNYHQKRIQYKQLGCLPEGEDSAEALIRHTLLLLEGICPVLADVLDAELAAGNYIRTVCRRPSVELLDIALVLPFARRYKARQLEFLVVKDFHYGPDPVFHYQQYTSAASPQQRLLAFMN